MRLEFFNYGLVSLGPLQLSSRSETIRPFYWPIVPESSTIDNGKDLLRTADFAGHFAWDVISDESYSIRARWSEGGQVRVAWCIECSWDVLGGGVKLLVYGWLTKQCKARARGDCGRPTAAGIEHPRQGLRLYLAQ